MVRVMEQLHSACVAPEVAPVQESSTAPYCSFVHQTGSGGLRRSRSSATISLSGGTLAQRTTPSTGGTAPPGLRDDARSRPASCSPTSPRSRRQQLDLQLLPLHRTARSRQRPAGNVRSSSTDAAVTSRSARRSPPPPANTPVNDNGADGQRPGQRHACASPRPPSTKKSPSLPCRVRRAEQRGRLHDDHDRDRPLADRRAGAGRGHRGQRRHPPVGLRPRRRSRPTRRPRPASTTTPTTSTPTTATGPPAPACAAPSAVNQAGSTAKQRPVPGDTGATYAIELLPSTTQSDLRAMQHSAPRRRACSSRAAH